MEENEGEVVTKWLGFKVMEKKINKKWSESGRFLFEDRKVGELMSPLQLVEFCDRNK